MDKVEGKCGSCLCRLSLYSRQLGWENLTKICPVCGRERMEWSEPKRVEEKDYEVMDTIDEAIDKVDKSASVGAASG